MGLRYRKSINLGGGFRVTLSKSGVSYSWGIPGYRITKTASGKTRRTVSIPGTGISYTDEVGRKRVKHAPSNGYNAGDNSMQAIESGSIDQFKSAEYRELIAGIEKHLKLNHISNVLLCCIVLIGVPGFIILPVIGIILKVILYTILRIDIEYTFNDDCEKVFDQKVAAWLILNKSRGKWQITHEAHTNNRKVNAGANRNVNRILFKLTRKTPSYIKTNISPVVFSLKNEKMFMLPDKILIIRGRSVGVVNYDQLDVAITQINFVESQMVASDAKIINYTWQYVNKNGSPDKRYSNNKRLPICAYGDIRLTSPEGINVEIQISSLEVARELGELLKNADL